MEDNMIKRKDIILLVVKTLDTFIKTFQASPYDFFYEEDARSILYSSLVSKWKILEMERLSGLKWIGENKIIVKDTKTIPFKAEYPRSTSAQNTRLPARFDIAYIEDGKDHDNFYDLPVSIAIELKLGSKMWDQCGGFRDDLIKLTNYQKENQINFTGIALYLYQPIESEGQQDLFIKTPWFKSTFKSVEEKEISEIPEKGVIGFIATINQLYSSTLLYNSTNST